MFESVVPVLSRKCLGLIGKCQCLIGERPFLIGECLPGFEPPVRCGAAPRDAIAQYPPSSHARAVLNQQHHGVLRNGASSLSAVGGWRPAYPPFRSRTSSIQVAGARPARLTYSPNLPTQPHPNPDHSSRPSPAQSIAQDQMTDLESRRCSERCSRMYWGLA